MTSATYNYLRSALPLGLSKNLPASVSMQGGNGITFRYLADGRRVETVSETWGTPLIIPAPLPGLPPPPPMDVVTYDTERRFGQLTFRNGIPVRYDFLDGYFSLYDDEGGVPELHPYLYITDHLGSVRLTVDGNGSNSGTTNARQGMEYLPSGAIFRSTDYDMQTRRFCGKELLTMHGWDMYDSKARLQYSLLPRFSTMDPLAEKYYGHNPYAYCLNDPINNTDINGDSTIVYATKLPGANIFLAPATHTFISVENPNGKTLRFAYGPKSNDNFSFLDDQLVRCFYQQDQDVVEGKADAAIKARIPVTPPQGMSVDEFDCSVIDAANSFGNEEGIRYCILPMSETSGNCNTSTTTVLSKAGLPYSQIRQISSMIPGIKTGFGTIKPWTKTEQRAAIQRKNERIQSEVENRFRKPWLR